MDKPKPVVAVAVAAMGETAFEEKDDVRLLLQGLPVKHAGLALSDPTKSAESNYEASVLVASHLLAALRGTEAFRSTEHVAVIKAVRSELTSRKKKTNDTALYSVLSKLPCDLRRTVERGKQTGQWLAVTPSTFNDTELSAQEFRDALFLSYGRSPGDLPSHCDGCGQKFTIQHALECKKGGKVILLRHNELRDEIGNLAANAFICGKPIRSRADLFLSQYCDRNRCTSSLFVVPV
jgi:hypothetical protein